MAGNEDCRNNRVVTARITLGISGTFPGQELNDASILTLCPGQSRAHLRSGYFGPIGVFQRFRETGWMWAIHIFILDSQISVIPSLTIGKENVSFLVIQLFEGSHCVKLFTRVLTDTTNSFTHPFI